MFRLLIAPLVAATFCAVYWAAGSIAIDLALAAWRDNPSVRFDYSAASTSGFPARFQTRITEIEFQDADTGLGWAAPDLTLSAPTLHPTQVSAVFARSQSIRTRHGRISITSDAMRGTIDLRPTTSLALRSSDISMTKADFTSDAGWTVALAQGRFASRLSETDANRHEISSEIAELALPDAFRMVLDPTGSLPGTIERITLECELRFDAPLDRAAFSGDPPSITRLDVKSAHVLWGEISLDATGLLDVAPDGEVSGRIDLKAVNWRRMLEIARATGLVPQATAQTYENALEILAGLSGDPDTLDLPVTFRNGRFSVGPIPFGPAPRLIWP